jgi:alkyl hydroperoxide reductase subunit AhpC
MRKMFFALCAVVTSLSAQPQSKQPEVGKPLPKFKLQEISHYKLQQANNESFRGKWLLLQFWYSGCSMSIKSFPKLNTLKKKFEDEMEFILVGCTDPNLCYGSGLRDTYERLRLKMHLDIASAYDSLILKEWEIYSMPRVFIVDPNGILRVITNGTDMTSEKISKLIAGEAVSFQLPEAITPSPSFDSHIVDRENLIYSTLLTEWSDEKRSVPKIQRSLDLEKRNVYVASKVTLFELFNLAYFGQPDFYDRNAKSNPYYGNVAFEPVLEIADKSVFLDGEEKVYYNFAMRIPGEVASVDLMMTSLQAELQKCFGFDVTVETRRMPVWKLVATDAARKRLLTKHNQFFFSDQGGSGGAGGFTCNNCPMPFLFNILTRYINEYKVPYLNETQIPGNIDITIDALMMDISQVQSELKKNGLELVESTSDLKVIVVKDHQIR